MFLMAMMCWLNEPSEYNALQATGPQVMVLDVDPNGFPGEDVWFEIAYLPYPGGEPIFSEPGEKLWWIQDKSVLVLGASGMPLPDDVTRRSSVWVAG